MKRIYYFMVFAATLWAGTGLAQPDLSKLPKPVLDAHPEWITLYNGAWELAKKNIRPGTPENGFVDSWVDEAMSHNKIWQWDICFITMFTKYGNGEFARVQAMENFYRKQRSDGFICRELSENDGTDIYPNDSQSWENPNPNPPIYSWAEWDYYLVSGDASHFTKQITSSRKDDASQTKTVLQRLVDYFYWIKNNIRHSDGYYRSDYWANGMDDSPKYLLGLEGAWHCITTQQALNALYVARIAQVVGDNATYSAMMAEYEAHKKLVNDTMWHEEDKMYYDLTKEREFFRRKTISSFWPMVAEVAEQQHAADLVAHLTNPSEFWIYHMIPTLSADDPSYNGPTGEYWRGAVWAPTNYQTVRGLLKYGYHDIARQIAENHIANVYKVYAAKNTIYENYAPEADAPSNDSYPDFVGWSGLGPIAMLIENVIGLEFNAPANKISWFLAQASRNGIENLHYDGGVISSMVCASRSSASATAQITIDTNVPFTLTCRIGGQDVSQSIQTGEHTYTFSTSGSTTTTTVPSSTTTTTSQSSTTTTTAASSYCSSSGGSQDYEWIAGVAVGNLSNASGANGYGDFTSQTLNVQAGSSESITLTPGFASSAYAENWAVRIDFNQNNSFDDAGELVYSGSGNSGPVGNATGKPGERSPLSGLAKPTVTGTISIPSSASSGTTRMRVSMSYYDNPPAACGSLQYGEVEDYSVNISPSGVSGHPTSSRAVPQNYALHEVYPNPFNPGTNIKFDLKNEEQVKLSIYNSIGQLINTVVDSRTLGVGSHTYYWNGLNGQGGVVPSGVYLIKIQAGQFRAVRKATLLK